MDATIKSADIVDDFEQAAINWFQLLYGQCREGWITLWHMPEKTTKFFNMSQYNEANDYALRQSASNKDVYFGLGLRGKEMNITQRGGREDVSCITSMWVDIDVKGSAHAASNLPESIEEAVNLAYSFPLSPTVIVKSANGLHVYWLLKQPKKLCFL